MRPPGFRSLKMDLMPALAISAEVSTALAERSARGGARIDAHRPRVAATGQPRNRPRCRSCRAQSGAIATTVAVLHGKPTIGLTEDRSFYSWSRRGAKGQSARSRRGNRPQAPRGDHRLGDDGAGPHRGHPHLRHGRHWRRHREEKFDISADLTELARTPVSSFPGAKSILHLPRTLESEPVR